MRRALALCAAATALAGCNGGTVDAHALKRDAQKVSSLATEGGLLAKEVAKGSSTKNFASVHAQELARAASNMADALATRPISHGIEAKVHKLSLVSKHVSIQLDQLHSHPTDRSVAKSLERPLANDADAADKLSK